MERVTSSVVESLLNRRLVVQVGERLDTYWDIFRDYLNTGRIPVEDSYILRQGPVSVSRLLREVVADDGDSRVPDIAERLSTSENGVFNLSRELRLLGATAYEANRVRLLPEVWQAEDREAELRRRVAAALRRHRGFSVFATLADRIGGVTISAYARELPATFPAVDVKESTWVAYARVHLQWFHYAGLAVQKGATWHIAPEGTEGEGDLLGGPVRRRLHGGFPHDAPGPALRLLKRVAAGEPLTIQNNRRTAAPLLVMGAIRVNGMRYEMAHPDLVVDGVVNPTRLRELLLAVTGVPQGLALIETDPGVPPTAVGRAVKSAVAADWSDATVHSVGKYLRAWAREAGLAVRRVPRVGLNSAELPLQSPTLP